jgi:hypothetical protein
MKQRKKNQIRFILRRQRVATLLFLLVASPLPTKATLNTTMSINAVFTSCSSALKTNDIQHSNQTILENKKKMETGVQNQKKKKKPSSFLLQYHIPNYAVKNRFCP